MSNAKFRSANRSCPLLTLDCVAMVPNLSRLSIAPGIARLISSPAAAPALPMSSRLRRSLSVPSASVALPSVSKPFCAFLPASLTRRPIASTSPGTLPRPSCAALAFCAMIFSCAATSRSAPTLLPPTALMKLSPAPSPRTAFRSLAMRMIFSASPELTPARIAACSLA
jgi:hypothetical protein